MRYSVEPRDVKGYGFLSFAKNMSNKYSQKLLDGAKNSTIDAIKTASKTAIEKIAEATGDLTDNKIAGKITNALNKSSQNASEELSSKRWKMKMKKIY